MSQSTAHKQHIAERVSHNDCDEGVFMSTKEVAEISKIELNSLTLAGRIIDLLDQSGAAPREQQSVLDIVGTIVLDRLLYGPCRQ